jgi:hypothetical protein
MCVKTAHVHPASCNLAHGLTRYDSPTIYRCFALPQLLYRWRHQSGIFWIISRVLWCRSWSLSILVFMQQPYLARISSLLRVHDHTRHTTFDRTPPDEWSARKRDLCFTTHNTDKRQIYMTPPGLEPAIPETQRSQTHALDRGYWVWLPLCVLCLCN